MVLNYIWIAFFVIAFVVAVVQTFVYGNTGIWTDIMNASFSSARSAFDISLGLTGVLTSVSYTHLTLPTTPYV